MADRIDCISAPRVEIQWRLYQGCGGHQHPCKGCSGYCDLEDTEEELYEVYGIKECAGETTFCQTTVWCACITFIRRIDGNGNAYSVMDDQVEGVGQTPEQALAAAEAEMAAVALLLSPLGHE